MRAFSMYTSILVCSLSNLLLNEHDDDDELMMIETSIGV